MSKTFYQLYHANLAFSAIEEESLGDVIDKTYFALLYFVQKTKIKVALEISGYSLQKIQELRPSWIELFKTLYSEGLVELVGSGYMQIIAPLVPYKVNIINQQMGIAVYKTILDISPTIAYVNEQVFSKSLVDIYREAGYKALMMEWNNSVAIHKEWQKDYAYTPLYVEGVESKLPLLWTDSILFQQFQRTVHTQQSFQDYFDFFHNYVDELHQCVSIYSSDLEVFNYRPGRFETEAIIEQDEWKNIAKLSVELCNIGEFLLPSEILQKYQSKATISLTNSSHPIIIKKQDKYSLSRWAGCGRDANFINTLCYQYFQQIKKSQDQENWQNLLHFWGSDYRTHTTKKKWQKALDFFEHNLVKISDQKEKNYAETDIKLIHSDNILVFKKGSLEVSFLLKKGLALHSVFKNEKKLPFGTVKHGELSHISHVADFFTGISVIESAQTKKVTDLVKVEEYSFTQQKEELYTISTKIILHDIATLYKSWQIDTQNNTISLTIKLHLKKLIVGSIRLGSFSMLHKNKELFYICKNGGNKDEKYSLKDTKINQQAPKSLLQSSQGGLGLTDNSITFKIEQGEDVRLTIDKEKSFPFVMLEHHQDTRKQLTRLHFSVQELDDTLKENREKLQRDFFVKYTINL